MTTITTGPGPSATPWAARDLLRWCLRVEGRAIAVATALTTLWQLAIVSLPLSIQRALDDGLVAGNRPALLTWTGVIAGTGLFAWVTQHAGQHLNYMAGAKIVNRLRARLSDHLLSLDTRTAGAFGRGDLQARNSHDVDLVWIWVGGTVAVPHLVIGLGAAVVAVAVLDPLLALLCVAAMAVVLVTNVVFGRALATRSAALSTAHGERADLVDELVSGGLTVRGSGGETALLREHHARSAEVSGRALGLIRVGANWSASSSFVPLLAIGAGIGLAAPAVLAGTMTVGGLTAFATWMLMLTATSTTLSVRMSQRAQAVEAATRIAEVLATTPGDTGTGAEAPVHGSIELSGVTVAHEGRTLLGPLDLTVEPGEFAVVTGPVAGGKSTLLRLLVRLQEPDTGRVTYGGIDLRDLDANALRGRIGLVPQRPVLVSGTVADNLTLGLPDPPGRTALRRVCRAAAILDEIDALPDGLDTVVGEGGATLSGGQRRRVALARALLRRPDVLLLDDVTSAVDEPTEERMLAGVRELLPHATILAVSHRPAVLRAATRIIPLPPPSGATTAPRDVSHSGNPAPPGSTAPPRNTTAPGDATPPKGMVEPGDPIPPGDVGQSGNPVPSGGTAPPRDTAPSGGATPPKGMVEPGDPAPSGGVSTPGDTVQPADPIPPGDAGQSGNPVPSGDTAPSGGATPPKDPVQPGNPAPPDGTAPSAGAEGTHG
ncbi:ABC transporter ATP-binding protein [Streptosporangium saharense]|uniref:ABC transporter ATP-binding protein n=1 Tax=Streptosporangium saharense TaxID=1706840 RepID=UPI003415ED80